MDTLIEMSGLVQAAPWILITIFLLIVFQEAVNGFHDTANAVATAATDAGRWNRRVQQLPCCAHS